VYVTPSVLVSIVTPGVPFHSTLEDVKPIPVGITNLSYTTADLLVPTVSDIRDIEFSTLS